MTNDRLTILAYKAGVNLLLENSDFDGNDRDKKYVTLCRTEELKIIPKGSTANTIINFPRCGLAESFSVFRTVVVEGDHATLVHVPYPRILAAYFMKAHDGSGGDLFMGDDENEFNADATGLPRFYAGSVHDGENIDLYRDLFKKAEGSLKVF